MDASAERAGAIQHAPAETQLALPSIGGSSQREQGQRSSRRQSQASGFGDDGIEGGGNDSPRLSQGSDDSDELWADDSMAATKKRSKSPFGAVTDWVDDYRTRKSGYGPPYYSEYGGDLPRECDRMGADLIDVDELLRNGANPNLGHREDQGLTPIHFAARFGNVELLKMLKRAGGDPGITNALGLTPLSYSCAFKLSLSKNGDDSWERQQVAAIRWLLGQGANPNHVDKAGYTPLAWACRSGILPAVVALVEAGADVMQRRPELPGGSQVRLPKADPLAVTTVKQIERYVQNKINAILLREEALLRRECKVDLRSRRLKEIQAAIARKKEARAFVIQEKQRMKQTEELSLELMKVDKAEEARKARRDWLRLMKVSPGIWVKVEASAEEHPPTPQGVVSAGTPGLRARKPRPRWVFDTSTAVSKREAEAHGVLEEARQVEAFIINGGQKQKILAPRWRSMTGKRLLRLEHGQRVGMAAKVKGRRRGGQGDGSGSGGVGVGVGDVNASGGGPPAPPLSGLEEEGSDTSSSSGGSEDGN
ncbi:unnamed protein product [Ectocarpus fasciculatus]